MSDIFKNDSLHLSVVIGNENGQLDIGTTTAIQTSTKPTARYVTLKLRGTGELTLCEIQVLEIERMLTSESPFS